MPDKKIIHIDMDCFYAAVEMRDDPSLRSIPLAIGGTGPRSVLSTCNYLARKFGIRSAMSSQMALRLCPGLKIIPGQMSKYKDVGLEIREIFKKFSDLIEPLGRRAYIDVSHHKSATLVAKEIKKLIREKTQLTASAGVAPNKFLAKIASDWKKPDGLFVITPKDVESFVLNLDVKKINGVGKVTNEKLNRLGIFKCRDLQKVGEDFLIKNFGSYGKRLHELSFGIDHSSVKGSRQRKSMSTERTFSVDLNTFEEMKSKLEDIYKELTKRTDQFKQKVTESYKFREYFIKVKFNDFKSVTAQGFYPTEGNNLLEFSEVKEFLESLLLLAYERGNRPVRLLGIGIRIEYPKGNQLSLL